MRGKFVSFKVRMKKRKSFSFSFPSVAVKMICKIKKEKSLCMENLPSQPKKRSTRIKWMILLYSNRDFILFSSEGTFSCTLSKFIVSYYVRFHIFSSFLLLSKREFSFFHFSHSSIIIFFSFPKKKHKTFFHSWFFDLNELNVALIHNKCDFR